MKEQGREWGQNKTRPMGLVWHYQRANSLGVGGGFGRLLLADQADDFTGRYIGQAD